MQTRMQLDIANTLWHNGQQTGAKQIYEHLLTIYCPKGAIYRFWGQNSAAKGQVQEAIQLYQRAIDSYQDLLKETAKKDHFYYYDLARIYYDLALIYRNQGDKRNEREALIGATTFFLHVFNNPYVEKGATKTMQEITVRLRQLASEEKKDKK